MYILANTIEWLCLGNSGANMSSSNSSSIIPIFNIENYHIWAVKTKFFFKISKVYETLILEADSKLLSESPTICSDESLWGGKAGKKIKSSLACIHITLLPKTWTWKHLNRCWTRSKTNLRAITWSKTNLMAITRLNLSFLLVFIFINSNSN